MTAVPPAPDRPGPDRPGPDRPGPDRPEPDRAGQPGSDRAGQPGSGRAGQPGSGRAAPRILVLAKAPVPGRVKTRLCPPCTPEQAARIAAAALADTVDAALAAGAGRPLLAVDARLPAPAGTTVLPQRGDGLGERIAAAFADASGGVRTPLLLVGMDTPQAGARLLARCLSTLDLSVDAVLGGAEDGGWWALGLHDPAHAALLAGVPMSTPDTGRLTLAALESAGLRVAALPVLRDVDTWADAVAVAGLAPHGRFAAAVRAVTPALGGPPGRAAPQVEPSPVEVYEAGLRAAERGAGAGWQVRYADGDSAELPLAAWFGTGRPGDAGLLSRCGGSTLDLGCGPGRLTALLAARGIPALGVDLAPYAVVLCRRRGGVALHRDLFAPLPGEGRWRHVLLADGNVGIGGDPAALLRRCRTLLHPGGTVLVETDRPGTGLRRTLARLERPDGPPSAWFRWAHLDGRTLDRLAPAAGLTAVAGWGERGRWFSVLVPAEVARAG